MISFDAAKGTRTVKTKAEVYKHNICRPGLGGVQ